MAIVNQSYAGGSGISKGKVSSAELRNTATSLNNENANLKEILDRTQNEMLRIGSEEIFSGRGAGALHDEFNKLSQKFADFSAAVNSCSDHLNKVAERYDEFEKTIESIHTN